MTTAFYIFITILFLHTNEFTKEYISKFRNYLYSININNKLITQLIDIILCPFCSIFWIISLFTLQPFTAMFYSLIAYLYVTLIETLEKQ